MDLKLIGETFIELAEVIKALRTPVTGCPWDLEQTHQSLRPYLIEESYEVLQAIDSEDDKDICDELGDILLQVMLHAQVASDRGAFDITDIINAVKDKMIRRHPHVFSDTSVSGSREVLKNWEQIKQQEQASSKKVVENENESETPHADRLAKIPSSIPALLRAQRVGEKAARVSFDWKKLESVLEKVQEEVGELEEEISKLNSESIPQGISNEQKVRLEHEIGDVLFSISQLSRWLDISAEDSLRTCSTRFIDRFRAMEIRSQGSLKDKTEDELEQLWQAAKKEV